MLRLVITASLSLWLLSLSAQETEPRRFSMKDYQTWLQARLTSLQLGDPRDSVISKMGGLRPIRARGFGLNDEFPSPYRLDQLTLSDGTQAEVIWYKVWEKEKTFRYAYTFTALVLRDGKLIGQGVSFAQGFALEQGFKLDMP